MFRQIILLMMSGKCFVQRACLRGYAGLLWAGLPAGLAVVEGVQISADTPGSTEMRRKSAHAHLSHEQPRLQWHTLPQQWQPGTWPTFFSVKGGNSLSYNHQPRHCNLRASWCYTWSSPQICVWHLKTPSSSRSPRGQPIRGLVVKSSPDPPGRTKKHYSLSS